MKKITLFIFCSIIMYCKQMNAQCDPSSTNSNTTTFIDDFTTTNGAVNISNTTSGLSAGHYANNFATMTVSNYATATFDFSVAIQGGTVGCAIWVDWDGNLTFDSPGEVVYNTTSYANGPFTGTITIPGGTADGDYYMRVMIDWNDSNPDDDACALNFGRGEVEDYKVTVDSSLEPACLPPSSLTVTPSSLTEASLGWMENGTAMLWDIEIVDVTAMGSATGTPTVTGVSNPYSATMLSAGNSYEFYVRADCAGDGTSTWEGPFAWTQPALGETCALPVVLTVEADCSMATPYTIDYATAADTGAVSSCDTTTGNTGAWFEFTAPASGIIRVNTSDSNEIAIFDACGGTEIVCNSTIATSHLVQGLTGSAVYKLVVWKDGASTGTTDVCIQEINCLAPSSLTATPSSLTEADLGWTENGMAMLWDIEIVDVTAMGSATGTPTATGVSNPYSATMLTSGNNYEFYVRADCAGDGTSIWVGPFAWTQPALGDTCALPISIAVETDCSTATPYTIDYATAADTGPASSCDTTTGNTGAWFEFTAPANGSITVNTSDSNEIAIFDACGGTEIVCNSTIATSHTVTGLTASAVYKLVVWKDSASTGTTDVCLEEISCPDPSALTVTNITETSATLGWTESGTAGTWNIEWGAEGFTQGMGTVITGTTSNPYNLSSGLAANMSYDFYVQSACGGSSSNWVGPFNFFTGYCTPSGTSTATYIDNFSTTNGSVNVSNLSSGLTAGNFQDNYSTMTVSGIQGGTFDFNVEIVSGTVGCAIWIDWNSDFVFDTFEAVFSTTSYGNGPFTGTVTIPMGAADGDYRMRVMIDWNDSNPGNDSACSLTSGRGEVEDYKVTVDASLSTTDFNQESLFTYYPNPVNGILTLNAQQNITDVSVYSMLGQQVIQVSPNTVSKALDMSKLQTGAYFVKVTIGEATETIRIIKN